MPNSTASQTEVHLLFIRLAHRLTEHKLQYDTVVMIMGRIGAFGNEIIDDMVEAYNMLVHIRESLKNNKRSDKELAHMLQTLLKQIDGFDEYYDYETPDLEALLLLHHLAGLVFDDNHFDTTTDFIKQHMGIEGCKRILYDLLDAYEMLSYVRKHIKKDAQQFAQEEDNYETNYDEHLSGMLRFIIHEVDDSIEKYAEDEHKYNDDGLAPVIQIHRKELRK